LPAETLYVRRSLLKLSLAKPSEKAEAILKTLEIFICGDMPYITNSFSTRTNVLKIATNVLKIATP